MNSHILKATPLFPMEPPHFIRLLIPETLNTDFVTLSPTLCVTHGASYVYSCFLCVHNVKVCGHLRCRGHSQQPKKCVGTQSFRNSSPETKQESCKHICICEGICISSSELQYQKRIDDIKGRKETVIV